jgi:hypothetical protein
MTKTIAQIVAEAIEGQCQMSLEEIAAHGIHNITNDYHGDSDEEYKAYSDEFERQSNEALGKIEAQRNEE